jgi:hypothetical protein
MKLEDFRVEKGWTYAGLAKRISDNGGVRITPKMAERYCKGAKPRHEKVFASIFKLTVGRVTPNDWYRLPAGKRAAELARHA